jgi:hypothetical protein
MLKKSMGYLVAGSVITAAITCAAPAVAHHSSAMFDLKKSVTVDGVVQEWQFTNPHCYLLLTVGTPDAPDKKVLWTLETAALNLLIRDGIRRDTYKYGDKVSVTFHPMRNGSAAGQLVSVTGADHVTHKVVY